MSYLPRNLVLWAIRAEAAGRDGQAEVAGQVGVHALDGLEGSAHPHGDGLAGPLDAVAGGAGLAGEAEGGTQFGGDEVALGFQPADVEAARRRVVDLRLQLLQ